MASLARYVDKHCDQPGRVLVEHWSTGELMRWATSRPILGGFPDRRLAHEDAFLFRRYHDPRFFGKALDAYLRRYNVKYLLISQYLFPHVERRRDLFEPMKLLGGHRIYRVKQDWGYVADASADVRFELNKIEVNGLQLPGDAKHVVLRFHFHHALRCRAPAEPELRCRLERQPVEHDRVGLLRVVGEPRLPKSFVIELDYGG